MPCLNIPLFHAAPDEIGCIQAALLCALFVTSIVHLQVHVHAHEHAYHDKDAVECETSGGTPVQPKDISQG